MHRLSTMLSLEHDAATAKDKLGKAVQQADKYW